MTTWTQFCPFLTTTYLNVDIFNLERGQKLAFLDHLPSFFVHLVIECSQTQLINIFSYGSVIACYLMHKEIYTHVVVYEEMTSNIIAGTKTLFEKLDFPSDYVPETLTG